MEISFRGGGIKTKDRNFHFFFTPFLSQDWHAFASPVGPSLTKGF